MKSTQYNFNQLNKEISNEVCSNQNFDSNNETKYLPQSLLNEINTEEYNQSKMQIPVQKKTSESTCGSNLSNYSKQKPSYLSKIEENINNNNIENFDNFIDGFQSWGMSNSSNTVHSGNSCMTLTKVMNDPSIKKKTVSNNNLINYSFNFPNDLNYSNNCNYLHNNHLVTNLQDNLKNKSMNFYNRSNFNYNKSANINNLNNVLVNNFQKSGGYNNSFPNMININNLKMINSMNYLNNMNSNNNENLFHANYATNLFNSINVNDIIGTSISNPQPFQKKKKPSCGDVLEAYSRGNLNLDSGVSNRIITSKTQLDGDKKNKKKGLSNSNLVASVKKNYSENLQSCAVSSILLDKRSYENEEDFLNLMSEFDSDIVSFIKTQKGSRILQKFMNKLSPENLDYFLNRLAPYFKEIMMDNYGNYFMQKLMSCCSGNQRLKILSSICEDLLEISNSISGTHSIQSLIETISMNEEEEILKNFIGNHILNLSFNSNGTHIIQKIISRFDEHNRDYLNDFIIDNLSQMCMNVNGVCVVKKFIGTNKDVNIRTELLKKFEAKCIEIVEDSFGNYAIQFAIDTYGMETCHNIINIIISNVVSLSTQKFSSNVVEKCIIKADQTLFNFIINEMFVNPVNFVSIMRNKFGIFVLKKAIMRMSPKEKIYIKEYLVKKIIINSGKDKIKFGQIIEMLDII